MRSTTFVSPMVPFWEILDPPLNSVISLVCDFFCAMRDVVHSAIIINLMISPKCSIKITKRLVPAITEY